MRKTSFLLSLSFLLVLSQAYALDTLNNLGGLKTLDDTTVEPYHVATQLGVEVEEQIDESSLIHGPTFDTAFGIGEWAEVGLSYEILSLSDSPSFDDSTGSGDPRLRIKVVPIQTEMGNIGFAAIAKIPSASNEDGLGTDEADIVLKAILGTMFLGDLHVFLNFGVAIQGDLRTNSSQDDFFLWGIGAKYPFPMIGNSTISDGLWLIGEFEGSVGPEDNSNIAQGEYTDSDAEFRAGLVKDLPWFSFAITGSVGITDDSPDWSFQIKLSKIFDLPVFTKE